MGRQRLVIVVAPRLDQARDFCEITKGLWEKMPLTGSYSNGSPNCMRGCRDAIIFVLVDSYKGYHPELDTRRGCGNEFIIVSDWR